MRRQTHELAFLPLFLQPPPMNQEKPPEVGLVLDDLYLKHVTGQHPEHFTRYEALTTMFKESGLEKKMKPLRSRPANPEDLRAVHDPSYVALAEKEILAGVSQLSTGDTDVCPDSWKVATHAAGSVCAAVDEVFSPEPDAIKRAFCAVRPPGHHATTPPQTAAWDSASSTTSPWPLAMRSENTASEKSQSSIGTSTTAMAPKTSFTKMTPSSFAAPSLTVVSRNWI
ncbi:hypothetical protein OAF21_04810 [Akkermansiaceae bacterium]|nr:hypothetical protein [Akkermansiaceae bacterium]